MALCVRSFSTRPSKPPWSAALGTKTVNQSGWHVYANMEHINRHLQKIGQPYGKGAYPRTDDILSRSMNISIGVVNGGLGSAFGININSDDEEIQAAAQQFRRACIGAEASVPHLAPHWKRPKLAAARQ